MVFLFVPNIIGYIRFAFTFMGIFTYRDSPLLTLFFLATSSILDAFDGMAARKLNQSTDFGAVLDMVCDRASDAVILAFLGALYPEWAFVFYGDILLDLTSHWFQMYAALTCGAGHHKTFKSRFAPLNLYYGNKTVLFSLCAGNGLFMGFAYIIYFEQQLGFSGVGVTLLRVGLYITATLFAIKKYMSVVQLISASERIAEQDMEKRRAKGL